MVELTKWQKEVEAVIHSSRITLLAAPRAAGMTTLAMSILAEKSKQGVLTTIVMRNSIMLNYAFGILEPILEDRKPRRHFGTGVAFTAQGAGHRGICFCTASNLPMTALYFGQETQRPLLFVDGVEMFEPDQMIYAIRHFKHVVLAGNPPLEKTSYKTPAIDLWWKAAWEGAADSGFATYRANVFLENSPARDAVERMLKLEDNR